MLERYIGSVHETNARTVPDKKKHKKKRTLRDSATADQTLDLRLPAMTEAVKTNFYVPFATTKSGGGEALCSSSS